MPADDTRSVLDAAAALVDGRGGDRRPREAEALLSAHILGHPGDVLAINMLGGIKHRLGKFADARALLGQAVAASPDFTEAHHNLGRVLQDLGLWAAAADSFHRALALAPGNEHAARALADVEARLAAAEDGARKKVMVVSHERSGTHFLMNTIAENFGYSTRPWIDLDDAAAINVFDARALVGFFNGYRGRAEERIIKSHHHYHFFAQIIEALLDEFHVFYVYRDPRDVMASYWRFIAAVPWEEGPVTASPAAFLRAVPQGGMVRYQHGVPASVLERWRAHVRGYLVEAPKRVRERLCIVRYEDLAGDFEATVRVLGGELGTSADAPRRPSAADNVVVPGRAGGPPDRSWMSADDEALIAAAIDDDLKPYFPD